MEAKKSFSEVSTSGSDDKSGRNNSVQDLEH